MGSLKSNLLNIKVCLNRISPTLSTRMMSQLQDFAMRKHRFDFAAQELICGSKTKGDGL